MDGHNVRKYKHLHRKQNLTYRSDKSKPSKVNKRNDYSKPKDTDTQNSDQAEVNANFSVELVKSTVAVSVNQRKRFKYVTLVFEEHILQEIQRHKKGVCVMRKL